MDKLKRLLDIEGAVVVPTKPAPIAGVSANELFDATFKVGDWVCLITDEDRVIQGKLLERDNNGCTLRQYMSTKRVYWGEVVFICHDGFPLKKLYPSGADEFIEALLQERVTRSKQELIRRSLTMYVCMDCGKLAENDHLYYAGRCEHCKAKHDRSAYYHSRRTRSVRFGDPFEVTNVVVNIVNPGNISKYFEEHNDEFIETVIMQARDGAQGHLYTLNNVIDFEH